MKKLIYYSLLLLSLSACRSNEKETVGNKDSVETSAPVQREIVTLPYVVEYNEQTQKIELKHQAGDDLSKASAKEMIEAVNLKYPEIQMQLAGTDHAVIHVKINDAAYLSQNIGSMGARIYLAEATYALTEISGIKGVDFIFSEGDHAAPGLYTRASFKDEIEVK